MLSSFTHTNFEKAVYAAASNKLLLLSFVLLGSWNMAWGQTYDANTTWTVPSNGTIMVEAWGGGGSGGCGQRSAGTSRGGGGGSGGNYAKKNSFSVSAGDVIVISIGNGGAGSSSGGDGGTTTVTIGSTTIISVAGGLKGGNAPTNDNGTAAQTNFTSSSCSGGCDVTTWGNAGTKADPGRGGGAGNGGGQQTANASTGTTPGGGGSGRNGSGTTNGVKCNGGSGRGGRVIISFTGTPVPTITGFTPSSVCASSSATVTITGTNFTGATAVSIGGTAAASYIVNSATQITATVGAGTTGQISVTTPGGTATSSGTLTVNTKPPTPAANNNSRCGTGTVAISVTTAINGTITWFSDISLTTQVASMPTDASGTTLWTTPSISSPTTYYATRTNVAGCRSLAVAVTASVNVTPPAPTNPVNYTGCAGTAAMSVSVPFTSIVNWYTDVALTNSAYQTTANGVIPYSPTLSSSQTYYVTRTVPATLCEGPATEVNATVYNAPTVATPATPSALCSGGSYNPTAPTVTDNGSAVTSQGWQIETSVGSNAFTSLTVPYTVAVADNGKKVLYTATNGCGTTNSATVTLTVVGDPVITNASGNYTFCIGSPLEIMASSSGGVGSLSYRWQFNNSGSWGNVTDGTPSGVTYSYSQTNPTNNVLSISNLAEGTYSFRFRQATNTAGCLSNGSAITVNVVLPPSAPTEATHSPSATQIVWNWNTVSGATGYKYSATNNYATATDNGTSNTFTQTVGLSCGTSYTLYVWAYNANCNSTATTLTQSTASCCTVPVVASTTAASAIVCITATTGGNISSDGGCAITERGVCYSITSPPTTANSVLTASGTTGSFTSNLTGLTQGTTYYVRAYAINSSGTSYGDEISFTTLLAPSNLNYSVSNAIYCLNAAITNNEPSNLGGPPTSYSINGTLPAGLSFNTTTGIISGTPTALAAATTYTITASSSCGNIQKDITIAVIDIPTSVSATPTPNPVCENATLTLAGSATDATTWSWTGPNSFSSIDQSPSISNLSVAAAGVYTLTASNICGSATAVNTASVTVNAAPTATTNGFVPAICQGGTTVALGGTFGGAATSAVWSDGSAGGTFTNNGGSTPNTTTYSAAANAPALVTLTLTTSGGLCGSTVANMQIVVNPNATANAGPAVAAVCQGRSSVALGGSFGGGATMAIWSDGGAGGTFTNNDGSTPETTTYTPAVNAPSTVTLTLTADAGSCGTASANKPITVNTTPTITVAVPGSRCDAGTVTVSVTPYSGNINWFANSSGGASLGSGNSYTTPSISSTTSYWAEAVAGSCVSLQRTEVAATVNTSPTVNAGGALSTICQGGKSSALGGSVGGGATGGVWSDGGIGGNFVPAATDLNAQWIPPTNYSGTATLTLTTSGATSPCTNVAASKDIVVNTAAIANAGADQSVGALEPTQLNGSVTNATGGTWTSNVAGTFSPNANTLNATWLPTDPFFIGTATLTLTTTGATTPCGNTSDVVNTTVATPSICSGSSGNGPATFTSGSGGTFGAVNEYEVSIDDGDTWASYTPGNSIDLTGATGSVQVRARRADTGCVNSNWNTYVLWYVLERPTVGNINGETVCLNTAAAPITVSASGNSGTLSYQWYQNSTNSNTGGTAISGATLATYTPSSLILGTSYYYNTVGYQGYSGCGERTNAAAVTVNGPSVADLAANDWLWTGKTNLNWETPTNWLRYNGNNTFSVVSTSPASTNNVIIKTGNCINADVTVNATETNALSVNAASAKNVSIRNGASLTSLSGNNNIRLHVYGNWLNEGMFYSNTGSVFLNGSGNQTITSKWGNSTTLPAPSGVSFYNLLVNNSGSGGGFKVSMLDNLNVLSKLTIREGELLVPQGKLARVPKVEIETGGQLTLQEKTTETKGGEVRVNEQ